ncbi:MSHA biogenesis protein MshK [Vibrio gallicus]|uniref:MSHA biogenesis protein MshK n=1 Tax=Vibrio gallicus TaxID=190897 RepID=UPI0021C2FE00|nr:MSHA biogenesis protein MshK [Vibrio gallicus]
MVRVILYAFIILISGSVFAEQDPTAPLGWYKPAKSTAKKVNRHPLPTLQSIICDSDTQCVAMLNDKILSKKQSVAGYKIDTITKEDVIVSRAGKTWQLQLFNSNVRR